MMVVLLVEARARVAVVIAAGASLGCLSNTSDVVSRTPRVEVAGIELPAPGFIHTQVRC